MGCCSTSEEMDMQRRRLILAAIGAMTLLGGAAAESAFAQTQGMGRRGDRRDNRQESRDVKQACKAGDEKTRPECREDKRDAKQEGRQDEAKP
jgi:hypothetical protein